jgi:hypothetical protein
MFALDQKSYRNLKGIVIILSPTQRSHQLNYKLPSSSTRLERDKHL